MVSLEIGMMVHKALRESTVSRPLWARTAQKRATVKKEEDEKVVAVNHIRQIRIEPGETVDEISHLPD
ncbi:hypothetical protein CC1G_13735 [Coprinopsis cinerea okayama7|uniref:Uncharacterized protein n=1 Tax=Coprinopsis cinerea (strain Okayama-7 / 130 / ATCC MYA-4618 / FGSC 9003) TaxID=240176 RepID=D6RJQ8_COPC7|nr:hypothetical protein CC1G_13735 [Coprinopsis cinerea okayama7\|eukprot:XP_002912203.1 hypothetical protein CC1G_13735 [Coprinopsis cinerea okayama7\